VDIWSLRLDDWEYNMGYGDALRDEVHNESITPLIGIFDMHSASLAAQHYGGMFVSGFGFAASYYGLPDIGFIARPDMVSFVQRLRLAFPQQHLGGYRRRLCRPGGGLPCGGASGAHRRLGRDPGGPEAATPLWPRHRQTDPAYEEYLEKLNLVLQNRSELVVVARTDATDESEIVRRAEMLAATDADVLLVDGVRSVEWIRKVRGVVGSKPLLFNQIAGGLSPRLSLTELQELGINVANYSTPCLFAAHTAMANGIDRTARRRRSTCRGQDR
jgi:2-methylisocitrate lyase-like PEP mutase family enzyme